MLATPGVPFLAAGTGSAFTLIATALAALVVGAVVAWLACAVRARGLLERARERADALVASERSRAEARSREIVAEAEREAAERLRAAEEQARRREERSSELEREIERRHRRLADRDRALARRDELLRAREDEVESARRAVAEERARVARMEEEILARLEEISGLTREEAQRRIVETLRQEARRQAAGVVREIREEAQRSAEWEAQKIIALAVERLASDYSAERTVSWVALPDPAMRGRIIGVEGRNIRAFERLTGMQLVLDENPDQVGISGFNPVRRELARRALEKLVASGTIHPRKIHQVVAQVRKKLDQEIESAGREAIDEFGFEDVHPEIVRHLGRLRFRTSYGQNVLEHVRECARICGVLAAELGLDQKLAQRAALLHDIGKAVDFEREGTHPEIGGELARQFGEPEVVINAIESHHEDCEVIHPISVLVAAADALSGARPGARRRTTVDYARRIAKLEELGREFEGVDKVYALQAGRELRVIVQAERVGDDDAALLAHDMAQRIQAEVDYPGRIKITVIREVQAQAVAR